MINDSPFVAALIFDIKREADFVISSSPSPLTHSRIGGVPFELP